LRKSNFFHLPLLTQYNIKLSLSPSDSFNLFQNTLFIKKPLFTPEKIKNDALFRYVAIDLVVTKVVGRAVLGKIF